MVSANGSAGVAGSGPRFDSGAPPSPPVVLRPLARLLKDVVDARAALARARMMPGSRTDAGDEARARVLSAIEAYTAALEAQRLPVPYALRDELRIRRGVSR